MQERIIKYGEASLGPAQILTPDGERGALRHHDAEVCNEPPAWADVGAERGACLELKEPDAHLLGATGNAKKSVNDVNPRRWLVALRWCYLAYGRGMR